MRRVVFGLIVSAAVTATLVGLVPAAQATTACLPNPGAACGWSANSYGGTKIYGDPSPGNGTQDTFSSSNWDKLHSFKNETDFAACPMESNGGDSWTYLDLLVYHTNYSSLPSADHDADAVWFGVSTKVNCF
jgi:hypothetical protein